jgi:hypothetical protein
MVKSAKMQLIILTVLKFTNMKNFYILLPVFICYSSHAQSDMKSTNDSIYRKNILAAWRMNGDKLSPRELKAAIYKVPEATAFYKKAKTQIWFAAGLIIGGGLLAAEANRTILQPPYNPGRGYTITGSVIGFSGFYLLFKSLSNHKKAIKAYNAKKIPI